MISSQLMDYLFKRFVQSSMRFLTWWNSEEPSPMETAVMSRVGFSPPDSLAGVAPPVGVTFGEDGGERSQAAAGPEAGAVSARV